MMHVSVEYQDERLDFDIADESFVASWRGPSGLGLLERPSALQAALERPLEFPSLRQAVVPGDQVVIACDPSIAEPALVLETLGRLFEQAGVEDGDLTVLTPPGPTDHLEQALPKGARLVVHDPHDRTQLAYLATTKQGRRVYLNRRLIDADLVVPVGLVGFDSTLGYRGPWSVLFPRLSDVETLRAQRSHLRDEPSSSPLLPESFEVSWLLGTQFHLGLVVGTSGLLEVIGGMESAVRTRGIASLEQHWRFDAPSRAELVVVGIGRPGVVSTLDDLGEGLANAAELVQHGGKIVVLSRVVGEIGPSLKRLIDADDPKEAAASLRGHEGDDDYVPARRLAHALSRADVFLLSGLPKRLVEDLSLVRIEHPEHARRLVARSGSTLFVNQADLTRAVVRTDEES